MTSALELQTKLEKDQAEALAACRRLERERASLLVDKHAGVPAAVKRSAKIRAELDEFGSTLREMAQMQTALEPRVRLEAQAAVLAGRQRDAQVLDAIMDGIIANAQKIDAAVDALTTLILETDPWLARARSLGAELIMQRGGDVAAEAVNRLLALHTSVLQDLTAMVQQRLVYLGTVPSSPGDRYEKIRPIAETMSLAKAAVAARVQDRIQQDQRAAEVAEQDAAQAALEDAA